MVRVLVRKFSPPQPYADQRLTDAEEILYEAIVRAAPYVLTRESALQALYGDGPYPLIKILDVMFCKLRKKLTQDKRQALRMVWGRGYLYEPDLSAPVRAPGERWTPPRKYEFVQRTCVDGGFNTIDASMRMSPKEWETWKSATVLNDVEKLSVTRLGRKR